MRIKSEEKSPCQNWCTEICHHCLAWLHLNLVINRKAELMYVSYISWLKGLIIDFSKFDVSLSPKRGQYSILFSDTNLRKNVCWKIDISSQVICLIKVFLYQNFTTISPTYIVENINSMILQVLHIGNFCSTPAIMSSLPQNMANSQGCEGL